MQYKVRMTSTKPVSKYLLFEVYSKAGVVYSTSDKIDAMTHCEVANKAYKEAEACQHQTVD